MSTSRINVYKIYMHWFCDIFCNKLKTKILDKTVFSTIFLDTSNTRSCITRTYSFYISNTFLINEIILLFICLSQKTRQKQKGIAKTKDPSP